MKYKVDLIVKLQKKYPGGGFALISEKDGKVYAFGKDIKEMYDLIDKKKIRDDDKIVTHVPSSNFYHAFRFSVSLRKD